MEAIPLELTINGESARLEIEPRLLLSDVLRDELGMTGVKRGCDTGKCGACTVLHGGDPIKSCNVLAPQAEGWEITTVEGLESDGQLAPAQEAFWKEYGFQCGYCTPGFLMATTALIREDEEPSEERIKRSLAGNLCRCTGYVKIVDAVEEAARLKREGAAREEAD